MPDLNFQITGVNAVVHSLTPLLHFKVRISNTPVSEAIHAVLLTAQIQIQSPQRKYNHQEKEKLVELFGPPEVWGQTLRNRLWGHANATVGAFTGSNEAILPMSCTSDLSVTAAKYFYALETGEVPLLFLFSGSVFYAATGRLQVSPISWSQECEYRIQLQVYRDLMDRLYPNTAWLSLRRDMFERLYAHKRRHGLLTWEDTIEHLLQESPNLAESGTAGPHSEDVAV